MTTSTDFGRLLSAAKVLGATGDVSGARTLIDTARELSAVAICIKCNKRRQREAEALRQVEAGLRDGAADSKAERAAAA